MKESALHDEVTKKLSALASSGQAADTDRFITCLHLIQEHYPEFSDRFVAGYSVVELEIGDYCLQVC